MSAKLHTTNQVMDEIAEGRGRTCTAAARCFPAHKGDAESLDPSTIWRWMARGVKLADGRTLHLEAARVAGRILTSDGAIRRFIEAQAVESQATPATPPPTPKQRQRSAEKAGAKLAQMGI